MSECPSCGIPTDSETRSYKLCKDCNNVRYRKWVSQNQGKLRTYFQEYQKENKQELADYQKKWRMKKHKENKLKNDK